MFDSSSPILSSLNNEQKEAVTHQDGALLIIAGAGSGKTRVLTHRIAYFIETGIDPNSILAVTFTNKAAGVMRDRIAHLTRCRVSVGTFHSSALRILRENAAELGYPENFTIYDEHDQIVIIKECMEAAGLDKERFSAKSILEVISRSKDDLITPEEYERTVEDRYEEVVSNVYERYQKMLAQLRGMDFGDLLAHTVHLFDKNPAILENYQDRFRYIFVDEYQDTNHAQYRFVVSLAKAYGNITVVGDPDQSIYAWRGADIRNILDFERDFERVKVVKLEQNYRSTSNILGGANALIRNNAGRKEKELRSTRGEGSPVQLFEANDDKGEARNVVGKIVSYLTEGKTLRDMAIFYRTHAQSRVLEDEFRIHKIPYKIIGGVRFYDRKEIKDMIAYLRVISAPYDTVSLRRILNVPPRGLGKKTCEILDQAAERDNVPLYEVLENMQVLGSLSPKARATLVAFRKFMDDCRGRLRSWDVITLLTKIIAKTGYVSTLEADHSLEARIRMENIREFFTVVEEFQKRWTEKTTEGMLEGFLESISLTTDIDRWNQAEEMLTLMTLHTAKGLEFPIVFMVGMEEGLCPYASGDFARVSDVEEERRLCYVGMTRAKDILHMSFANIRHIYGIRNYSKPSRFLSEIPTALVEFTTERDGANEREEELEVLKDPFSDDEFSEDSSIDIGRL